jgi:hypothetical protein
MFDQLSAQMDREEYQARIARIEREARLHRSPASRRPARERVAAVLVALANRLAPTHPQPRTGDDLAAGSAQP